MVSVNSFTLEAIACANEIYRINIIITSGFTLTKIIFLNWATWTTIFTTNSFNYKNITSINGFTWTFPLLVLTILLKRTLPPPMNLLWQISPTLAGLIEWSISVQMILTARRLLALMGLLQRTWITQVGLLGGKFKNEQLYLNKYYYH